jgi:CRISPR/Cas system-associated exonuclease Cas4 (RecB family)
MSIYISQSAIDDYLVCKKKLDFRLNYEGRSPQTPEMLMGDIVHRAIEVYWNDFNKAIAYINSEIDTQLGSSKAYKDFCISCYTTYYENFRSLLSSEDRSEFRFKIPIGSSVFVVGRMDRVTSSQVFDWKTSRKPPKNVDNYIQFALYHWAFTKVFNKNPSGVYFASLTNGSLIRYTPNKTLEKILFKEIIPEMVRDIKSGNYTPTGVFKRACYNCVHSNQCLKELGIYDKEKKERDNLF